LKLFKHFDASDILFLAGGLVVCGGVWLIYRPAAVILLGLLLIILAVARAMSGRAKS
jgi:hypothetical protein